MADNEDDLVDYDEEEVRHTHGTRMEYGYYRDRETGQTTAAAVR